MPTLSPLKKTPPGESATMIREIIRNSGSNIINPNKLKTKSNNLFIHYLKKAFLPAGTFKARKQSCAAYIFAPSTGIFAACINDDLSLAINKTAFAISSGVPKRSAA